MILFFCEVFFYELLVILFLGLIICAVELIWRLLFETKEKS